MVEHEQAPSTLPAPPPRPRRRRWWAIIAGVGAVAVIAALSVVTIDARGDKSEVEATLAATQTERDAAEAALAEAKDEIDTLEGGVEERDDRISDLDAELRGAQATLVDVEDELTAAETAVMDVFALSLAEGGGFGEEAGRCMARSLVETGGPGTLAVFMEMGLSAPTSVTAELAELGVEVIRAAEDCGVSMEAFGGPIGVGYGDDAVLDTLHDDCAGGSGEACDQLFWSSGVGSDYERFGATCGGRFTLITAPPTCAGQI